MNNSKNPIRSVQTSMEVLEALQESGGAGVTELAAELGTTKGTVHNHLSTLKDFDYVTKDEDGTYHLGLRFVELAYHAKARMKILDLVVDEVDKLAQQSGEMALFTAEEHGLGVCLYRAFGEQSIQTPLHVGYRSYLHHTAVGKAILAYLPPERVEQILNRRGLESVTDRTITDRGDLYQELEAIRDRGYALNDGETIDGLVGIGSPIRRPERSILGAISIIGPKSRMSEDRIHAELADIVQRSVNVVEINATSI